jgi:hypothetical protein
MEDELAAMPTEEEREPEGKIVHPISFGELLQEQRAQQTADHLTALTDQFQEIMGNILESELPDRKQALRSLIEELITLLRTMPDAGNWKQKESEMEEEQKATWTTAYVNTLPDSCFLYVEPGDKDEEGKTVPRSKRHLPYKDKGGAVDLPHLRNAISRLGQSGTGEGWLSSSLRKRLMAKAQRLLSSQKKSLLDKALAWLKEAVIGVDEQEVQQDNAFVVWKEANGTFRWLAVYSNKFRDDDLVPEILSEDAHKEFVSAVDAGEWEMPSLRLWHVKGTDCGRTDYVAYDSSGFSLASGTFAADKQNVAEALARMDDLLVSHGMPAKEIQRDKEDPTIITRYRTVEVSPLPSWAAANRNTHFSILKEVDNMALPDEKRRFLIEAGLGEEAVAELERQLEDKAKTLESEGVEFKEAETEQAEAKPEPEVQAESVPAPDYATRDEVAEAVGLHLKPLIEQVQALSSQIEAMGKELKELKKSEDERLKEIVEITPAASLYDRISSAIGASEAQVDGRSALAKAKPAEAPATEKGGPTLVPWLNELILANANRGG